MLLSRRELVIPSFEAVAGAGAALETLVLSSLGCRNSSFGVVG